MKGWDHVTHLSELEKRCASLWFKVPPQLVVGPIHGLIVGECPGKSTRATLPLFPYPPNSSGGRLLRMSGLPIQDFLGRLMRRNLFENHVDVWSKMDAYEAARKIVRDPPVRRVLLCGQRVAEAFGFEDFYQVREAGNAFYAAIPHPSGLNRLYNDPRHVAAARQAVRWVAGREVDE